MEVPKHTFIEMIAITKVFHDHKHPDSTDFKNAVRRAKLLHKKLIKLGTSSSATQKQSSYEHS